MWPPYHQPRPLVFFYKKPSPLFDRLVAEVTTAKLPLFPYPVETENPWAALPCLWPLGFAGAVLAEALPPPEGVRLEAEAQAAGLMDLAVPGAKGLWGQYTEGVALERFLAQHFPGAKALWLGPLRPALAPFLRPLAQVAVAAGSFAEGDSFLARLPERARGPVVARAEEVQALALRADLLLYAGGRLSLEHLQPFHVLVALVPPDRGVWERVQAVYAPEDLLGVRVRVILEGLGYPV
ncbi:MAG: hypothetical protein NZ846_09225 [Thermus sp.]|uniref:hypothetical protein n=1 Tax=Thermus sp. TaxID=275 RepID=UPI0025F105CF|nr:hypothetical protein [Thermus sp.]MCS6867392.1 hypothetical protein [Thermus sp.]MCS7219137.1 hypothetical protein [Thermus sp.]MCX7850846.1 hypothetical protein [Thermus sp.]MDW8017539.1 hypothetical protein [Thermus sp.]MDW8356432.1 hypothetical protein [Thermus sp.]